MSKTTIEEVPRELIEGRLLAALDDRSVVAILANEDDLNEFINALSTSPTGSTQRGKSLLDDLIKLRSSAFA